MIGIVVVSHSRALARAAVALAEEMTPGRPVAIAVAAGLDDQTLGTDAVAISEALTEVDGEDGVLVLMDLGSAVLSAELALELVEEETRDRVLLCSAPLVEGLVAAVVTAASGADRFAVASEARNGLAGKQSQLADVERAESADAAPAVSSGRTGPEQMPPQQMSPSQASPSQASAEPVSAEPEPPTLRFTVTPAHGLHARPAALLVAEIRDLQAKVEIRNATTNSAWVPAASLSRIATLGALPGHEVEARATGEAAAVALQRLKALAERNFDEPRTPVATEPGPPRARTQPATAPEAAARVPTPSPGPAPTAESTPGVHTSDTHPAPALPASPGIAIGPVRHGIQGPSLDATELPSVPHQSPERETEALEAALAIVRARTRTLRDQLAHDEAAIFDAHLGLLEDPSLLDETRERIGHGESAARAWSAVARETALTFENLTDDYLAARAADVRAVGEQVLSELLPKGTQTQTDHQTDILVVPDLTPAQAATLDPDTTPGVVMAFGSPTGHASILTRARGVPAIVAAGAAVLELAETTVVALDGSTGEFVVDPDERVRADFTGRAENARRAGQAALLSAHEPAVTRDGFRFLVGANASTPAEATAARAMGADLIGLVRTEFLFLNRETAPDVDEQESAYLDLADAFGGERITLRTLDVGGDKPLGYLPMPAEANPFLGVRGLRIGLRRTDLLTDQLRAIVRVARQTPVSVMFPMVSTLDELLTARTLLDGVLDGREVPLGLQIGIMVEVPAAALKAATLAPHVDFFSIGTNDLTQYTLAAERGNDAVAALGDPFDPAVLQLIRVTCNGAAGQAEVAVCGEMAADVRAVPLLGGLGVTELSVTPRAVAEIKHAVRQTGLGESRELAAQALLAASAGEVREVLRRRS
jgi:phosphoenolpyruvate-protein phosphotransferase/dihydroxyacetone kinase phosphotransfer subunit